MSWLFALRDSPRAQIVHVLCGRPVLLRVALSRVLFCEVWATFRHCVFTYTLACVHHSGNSIPLCGAQFSQSGECYVFLWIVIAHVVAIRLRSG